MAEEDFAKGLRNFKTCVLVNNNLCGKLSSFLESLATFDEGFRVTSVAFFTPGLNLLSYDLENFRFKLLYWVILCWYCIKTK